MASGSSEQPRGRLSFEERRAVILAAATEVFADKGYDQAAMRGIAKAAAVTTPVLYDHFQSKIDLYQAVVGRHAENLVASWSTPPGTTSPEELLRQAATAFFSWIRSNRDSWRILFLDNPRDPEAIRVHQRVRNLATQAITEFVERTRSDASKVSCAIAAQLTGAGHALVTWWWDNPDVSTEEIVRMNCDLMWHGMRHVREPVQH
jgi:AcrR family transcriptional regulator